MSKRNRNNGSLAVVETEVDTSVDMPIESATSQEWNELDLMDRQVKSELAELADSENRFTMALVIDADHEFALWLKKFLADNADRTKADVVKMALVRYTSYNGAIPASKAAGSGYTTSEQSTLRSAELRAYRADNMALAKLIKAFDKATCDAIIEAAKIKSAQRKNGKVKITTPATPATVTSE